MERAGGPVYLAGPLYALFSEKSGGLDYVATARPDCYLCRSPCSHWPCIGHAVCLRDPFIKSCQPVDHALGLGREWVHERDRLYLDGHFIDECGF